MVNNLQTNSIQFSHQLFWTDEPFLIHPQAYTFNWTSSQWNILKFISAHQSTSFETIIDFSRHPAKTPPNINFLLGPNGMKNQYDDIHLHDVLIIKNHNPVPINIHFYYNNFIKYLRYIVIDGNVNIVIADLKVLKIVHKLLSKGLMSSYPAAKHWNQFYSLSFLFSLDCNSSKPMSYHKILSYLEKWQHRVFRWKIQLFFRNFRWWLKRRFLKKKLNSRRRLYE